jgi:hypothetical protein
MAASYAKYGGENGLAAELPKRKIKALRNYETRALSIVPQKKRPEIEQLSDRPFDSEAPVLLGAWIYLDNDKKWTWNGVKDGRRRSVCWMPVTVCCCEIA